MGLENLIVRSLIPEHLAEGPLIDDALRRRILLKYRRSDPWLEDKPTTQIDTSDLLVTPVVS